ncbi:T9SS type A sorting domain-containing protein [Seonamhaeicola sp.]|uniref:T9SS type A sorting domain-containing protein n=1 Tax=Seonamhaeicola sp. TaxID=1912245 RepID=UPI00260D7345|nr:T9SS type A sorting domain-containing protein [Seonamhaeicola sp.]
MKFFISRFIYIFVSIFLSSIGLLPSQNNDAHCGTQFSSEQLTFFNDIKPQLFPVEQKFLSNKFNKNDVPTKMVNAIPIKAHIIRYSNGSGGLSESDLDKAIENLNQSFTGSNLEFFLCGAINYIDDDALCHFRKGNEAPLIEENNVSGVINIYFTEYLENDSDESICGYSNNERTKDFIVVKNDCATNVSSLAHEMGHVFSLLHTHGPDNDTLTTELVDGSNCDTDGDGICDTPADPQLSHENVNNFCEYTGTVTDAHGHAFTPDTGNIMSYSLKACRSHFSDQQLARMYAFYMTQKHYLSCPSFHADFSVDISQTCENNLTVNFSSACSGIMNWEWDMDSDGITDYTAPSPTHTFNSGVYDVTLTVSDNSNTISKTYSGLIKVGVTTDALFDENFNDFEIAGDHGWTTNDISKTGYNWLVNHGETPSENTGPLNDHTEDGVLGKYIYAEASEGNPGDVAEFISPCIDVVYENSEIEFAYHMFGENIGELHVDVKTASGFILDVIPPLIGSQQQQQTEAFLTKNIDLSSYTGETINIRFRAIKGPGWDGDIAIDAVFLKTISVPISDETVRLYPNPVKDDLLFVKTTDENKDHLVYEISNLVGQTFSSGEVTARPINVSDLASGTYLLTITGKNSKVTKRFIR